MKTIKYYEIPGDEEALRAAASERFTDAYVERMMAEDPIKLRNELLGLELSGTCEWACAWLIAIAAAALEDSNAHTEAAYLYERLAGEEAA